jgi:hypothetical protein
MLDHSVQMAVCAFSEASVNSSGGWSRPLFIAGSLAMLVGALDPLEGSIIIAAGAVCATFGAFRVQSRHASLFRWSAALVCVGVAALWILSDQGGFGGNTGRSNWWGITILPYPIGWVVGVVAIARHVRDVRSHPRTTA